MMKWDEQRDLLLGKAGDDQRAMVALASRADISDSIIAFHAQQAVEKLLKALLCHLRVDYHRTHDLVALMDAISDAGRAVPPRIEKCKYFQPYAVRFRYDDPSTGSASPLDRGMAQTDVAAVGQWVAEEIGRP